MLDGQSHKEVELLRRVAAGDQAAFSELFRRYFDALYLTLLRYTQRHMDVEDIVQTVFIKAWENRHVFAQLDDPMKWFFITARNEFLDRFRKNRLSTKYRQHLAELFSESDVSPESIFIDKEHTGIYHQAIANLPEKQREAYLLSREKGLTYEEIAAEMHIARATVKEHIARAIRAIKAFFLSQTAHGRELILFLIFFKLMSAYFLYRSSLL